MNLLLLVVTLLLGQDRKSCTRAERDYESSIGLSPKKIGRGMDGNSTALLCSGLNKTLGPWGALQPAGVWKMVGILGV